MDRSGPGTPEVTTPYKVIKLNRITALSSSRAFLQVTVIALIFNYSRISIVITNTWKIPSEPLLTLKAIHRKLFKGLNPDKLFQFRLLSNKRSFPCCGLVHLKTRLLWQINWAVCSEFPVAGARIRISWRQQESGKSRHRVWNCMLHAPTLHDMAFQWNIGLSGPRYSIYLSGMFFILHFLLRKGQRSKRFESWLLFESPSCRWWEKELQTQRLYRGFLPRWLLQASHIVWRFPGSLKRTSYFSPGGSFESADTTHNPKILPIYFSVILTCTIWRIPLVVHRCWTPYKAGCGD